LRDLVVPKSLVESLKNIEQGVTAKLTTGFSPQEIVKGEKSVVELVTMKGLKAEVEVSFLKSIKALLQEAFKDKDDGFAQGLGMTGPALLLDSNIKTALEFTEWSEIKDHPMASQIVLTLSEVLEKAIDMDIKTLKEQKFDISSLDQDKLRALVAKGELAQWRLDDLKAAADATALLDEIDPTTRADAFGYFGGLASVETEIRGNGFAELISIIVRSAAFQDCKRNYECIQQAYLLAYGQGKHAETYGGLPKRKAEEAEPAEAIMQVDPEQAPPLEAGSSPNSFKPRQVKSRPTDNQKESPSKDAESEAEKMKQIKAYIQEQVQLRVNAAIDEEADRQIEDQMREFKEQYLREAM